MELARLRRATPFLAGVAIACVCFALFAWDLAHHYSPHPSPHRSQRWTAGFTLVYWSVYSIVQWVGRRRSRAGEPTVHPFESD